MTNLYSARDFQFSSLCVPQIFWTAITLWYQGFETDAKTDVIAKLWYSDKQGRLLIDRSFPCTKNVLFQECSLHIVTLVRSQAFHCVRPYFSSRSFATIGPCSFPQPTLLTWPALTSSTSYLWTIIWFYLINVDTTLLRGRNYFEHLLCLSTSLLVMV